uniref:prolipoprotein diacylglyceryl transferase n=1 Tax=Agathobacter sp. TaxID=2021311 RepID=UPI004056630E
MDYSINFPNLNIYLEEVGKHIVIGDLTIAYYGITIVLAMMAGIFLAATVAKKTGQNPDTYYDLALYAIVFALIGARLYYVAFQWDYYKKDLTRIFRIREGGLAIYGAVIAAVLTVFIYTRIKKLKFSMIADTAVLGLILGQSIGRWGNFFNREAFGDYCDNLFAMQLPVSAVRTSEITDALWEHATEVAGVTYIQVHPTFLYESLWNLALLALLLIYFKHRRFDGEIFLLYLFGYGIGRFWIESLRTDQLLLPAIGYPVSMALAAVLVVISLGLIIFYRKVQKSKSN